MLPHPLTHDVVENMSLTASFGPYERSTDPGRSLGLCEHIDGPRRNFRFVNPFVWLVTIGSGLVCCN